MVHGGGGDNKEYMCIIKTKVKMGQMIRETMWID